MTLISGQSPWPTSDSESETLAISDGDLATDVVVVGAGIVGAFVADALAECGVETIVLDRRDPAAGSTQASTALLQYDLDVPLFKLVEQIPRSHAVRAYRLGVEAIDAIEETTRGLDAGFERRRSLYVASSTEAVSELRREFEARDRIGLAVRWADGEELRFAWGLHAVGAIVSENAAQVDPVRLTDGLLNRAKGSGVRVFNRAEVKEVENRNPLIVRTKSGSTIRCRYLVHAGGYEAAERLPSDSVESFATFALLARPISSQPGIWDDRSLLWEYASPYLYARWNHDCLMIGGEDVAAPLGADCRSLLEDKRKSLQAKFKQWFPSLSLEVQASWCGPFLSTRDGVGFVGPVEADSKVLAALCYGGNGMTHAIIAARLIVDHIQGRKNTDAEIFRVRRFT